MTETGSNSRLNHKNHTMSKALKSIEKKWDLQPFLERLIFLMNEFSLNQDEATTLSKMNFKTLQEKLTTLKNK